VQHLLDEVNRFKVQGPGPLRVENGLTDAVAAAHAAVREGHEALTGSLARGGLATLAAETDLGRLAMRWAVLFILEKRVDQVLSPQYVVTQTTAIAKELFCAGLVVGLRRIALGAEGTCRERLMASHTDKALRVIILSNGC
jgi:hypothetical protein